MKTIHLSVHGSCLNGVTVLGPFDSGEEANDKTRTSLASWDYEEYELTSIEVDEISYDDKEDLYTISTGNCFDGITFNGLYKERFQAIDEAENNNAELENPAEWFVIKLIRA